MKRRGILRGLLAAPAASALQALQFVELASVEEAVGSNMNWTQEEIEVFLAEWERLRARQEWCLWGVQFLAPI